MTFVFWNPFNKTEKDISQVAELVTIYGLLRMLETVDREILNAGSSPVLTAQKTMDRVSLPHQEMGFRSPNSQVAEVDAK